MEVWDLKKQTRIEILQTGTNGKVLCMSLDPNEEVLVTGTSEGRIQVKKKKKNSSSSSNFKHSLKLNPSD